MNTLVFSHFGGNFWVVFCKPWLEILSNYYFYDRFQKRNSSLDFLIILDYFDKFFTCIATRNIENN